MMSKIRWTWFLALLFTFASTAQAAIISTETGAGMKIAYNDGNNNMVVDAMAIDTGALQASVDIKGEVTGASAFASMGINHTAEEANLLFSLGYDGNGYVGNGYMGGLPGNSNYFRIGYRAETDSIMTYDWSFDYAGSPFGLQMIMIKDGDNTVETLGNYGIVGHHEGSDMLNLMAGTDYLFAVLFSPNVVGGIGWLDGTLTGAISFDFNGSEPNPVPEPATMFLMGSGLLGLMRLRRKNKK